MSHNKKILIITGDAGESFEILYASHRLQEEGYEPVIAAPAVKRMNLVIHDFEPGWDTYVERKGYLVEADISFEDVNTNDYQAVLFPGGRAPEYLRNDPRVINIAKEFYNSNKYVFAICHGVQVLVTAGLVNNRKIACYEHVKFEVESCGGTYVTPDEAIKDGKIVTGKTWQSHPQFYKIVFNCLQESQEPVMEKWVLPDDYLQAIHETELDRQYNNRLQVPAFADYINGWELRSRQAVQQYPAVKNIAYDDLPREQLDIYQSQFKPRIQCPMLLAAGSTETEEFIDQSTKLYKCWRENISIEFSPKISNTKFFVNHSRNSKKFILDN